MRVTFNSYLPEIQIKLEENIQEVKKAIGEFVTAEAKDRSPYDTGLLESSIDYDDSEKNVVRIGTPVEYGKYQEFGTKYFAAQPYLQPAVYQNTEKILKIAAEIGGRKLK